MFDMTNEMPEMGDATRAAPAVAKDMGCEPAEFVRQLIAFAGAGKVDVTADAATVQTDDGDVSFVIEARPARKVGQMSIPRTAVEIAFGAMDAVAAAAFMGRFERSSMRMGG